MQGLLAAESAWVAQQRVQGQVQQEELLRPLPLALGQPAPFVRPEAVSLERFLHLSFSQLFFGALKASTLQRAERF